MNPLADSAAWRSAAGNAFCMTHSLPPAALAGLRRVMLYSGGQARMREGGRSVRVQVDPEACEANGVCAGLAPEVFDLDDNDNLHIPAGDVPAGLLPRVR